MSRIKAKKKEEKQKLPSQEQPPLPHSKGNSTRKTENPAIHPNPLADPSHHETAMYNQTNPNRPTSSTTYTANLSPLPKASRSRLLVAVSTRQLFPFPPPPAAVYPSPPFPREPLSIYPSTSPSRHFFLPRPLAAVIWKGQRRRVGPEREAVDLRSSQMNETDVGGV